MNKNLLFWDMLDAVGWVDQRRIRHEDCDVFTDPNPLHARSNCEECNRAKLKKYTDPVWGEQKELVADCHGEPLPDKTPHIDGNYFAYVGDHHFTAAFYKYSAVILVDGLKQLHLWGLNDIAGRNQKSRWFTCGGVNIHLREVSDCVFHMSLRYNGSNYNIIYGNGIDPSPAIWHKVKNRYLGKAASRKVDNLYRRLIDDGF